MEPIALERAYRDLVARKEVHSAQSGDDRREHPRFQVHTQDLWINDMTEFQVRDVSASGIGLAADFPVSEGETLAVSLRDDLRTQAVVIRCELVDSGSQYWAPLFHINCRIENEASGKALVVHITRADQGPPAHALA